MDESKPKTHKYGGISINQEQEVSEEVKSLTSQGSTTISKPETALILATKSGCTEIVEEILRMYPQAVEHVDEQGRNILHVAIKYHHLQIFDIVEKMDVPMKRLIRKIDNSGNSILHMVGKMGKGQGPEGEDMRSPALRLQEDLLLFERVKNISTTHFIRHFNYERQTAEMLFEKSSAQLRSDAKEWLKRTAENCSVVAVLIATVAFAAAYTIPGGPNQSTGYPILLNPFVIFTMADVLSLAFALTSVITFLSILTSPFRLRDFKQSLPQKLMLGVTLLIFCVSMMTIAFAATIILMIRNKQQWTKIALSTVAFLPVTIFAFSYLPLYASLMETFKYSLKRIEPAFPRCNKDRRSCSLIRSVPKLNKSKSSSNSSSKNTPSHHVMNPNSTSTYPV